MFFSFSFRVIKMKFYHCWSTALETCFWPPTPEKSTIGPPWKNPFDAHTLHPWPSDNLPSRAPFTTRKKTRACTLSDARVQFQAQGGGDGNEQSVHAGRGTLVALRGADGHGHLQRHVRGPGPGAQHPDPEHPPPRACRSRDHTEPWYG